MTLGAGAEGIGVLLLIPMIALLTGSGTPGTAMGGFAHDYLRLLRLGSETEALLLLFAGFALLMVLRAVVLLRRDAAVARLQIGFVGFQRLKLTRALASANWETVARLNRARVEHLLTIEVERCGVAAHLFLQSCVAGVMLIGNLTLALVLSPGLALLNFGLLLVSAVFVLPLLRRARSAGEATTTTHLALISNTNQFLGGLKQAFSHDQQGLFAARVEQGLDALTEEYVAFARQRTAAQLVTSAVGGLVAAATVLLGRGIFAVPVPVLIAILVLVARTSGPAMQLQQAVLQLANSMPAYRGVRGLERELADLREPVAIAGPAAMRTPPSAIALDRVTFRHTEATGAAGRAAGVEEISLRIAPGSFVGISGPSGAGKTTLADLLATLYLPQSGRIMVGGTALDRSNARAWRAHIAYVPQDPFLFHASVRENLVWSGAEVGDDLLWEALSITGAETLVRQLPGQLDAIVGERGILVSGGERQRLALARAILREPQLLILDEATSGIDIAAERALLARLRERLPAATILLIAHRGESLYLCDRLLTIEAGRLIEGEDLAAPLAQPAQSA